MINTVQNSSIQIKDKDGKIRPVKPGDLVRFRNGSEYSIGKSGELRVIRRTQKELSPSKTARKARRAAELRQMQSGRLTTQTVNEEK